MANETYRIDIEAHFQDKTGLAFKRLGDKCKKLDRTVKELGNNASKSLKNYSSAYAKAISNFGNDTSKSLSKLGTASGKALDRYIGNYNKMLGKYNTAYSQFANKYNRIHEKVQALAKTDYTIRIKLHDGDYKHLMRRITYLKSELKGLTNGRNAIRINSIQSSSSNSMHNGYSSGSSSNSLHSSGLDHSLGRITGSLTNLTSRSWKVTVGIIDEVTAPLRGIMNSLSSFQAFVAIIGAGLTANYGLVQPVKVADSYSRNLFGMQSILGQEAGQKMMDDIDKFAIATPYSTDSVLENARRMLAMGWNQDTMLTDLDTIGDAVSALGGTDDTFYRIALALGQVKTKGKLYAQEINQLAESGLAAKKYIALGLGYENNDEGLMQASIALEKGISSDEALSYILSGMQEYDGMMAKVNDLTAGGILSELKDTFSVHILRQWGQGLQTEVVDGLKGVREYLDLNQTKIARIGGALKDVARDSFGWFEEVTKKGIDIVTELTSSPEFISASAGGKMGLLWDNLIAKPFDEWWNSKGIPWANSVGSSIASGLISALGSAFSLMWEALPSWGKVLLAGWGAGKVANIASGVTNLASLFGAGSLALSRSAGLVGTAGAGVAGVAGTAGSFLGLSSLANNAKLLSLFKFLGAGAAAYTGISSLSTLMSASQTKDPYESEARITEGVIGIAGTILGGVIGSIVAPGVGTMVGAGLGGSLGSIVGSWGGTKIRNENEQREADLKTQLELYDELINQQKTYLNDYQTVDSLLTSHAQITKELNALNPSQIDEINLKEQERANVVSQLAQMYPDFIGLYEQENGLLSQQIDLLRQRSYEQTLQNQAQLEVEANKASREFESGNAQESVYASANNLERVKADYRVAQYLFDQEEVLRDQLLQASNEIEREWIMGVGWTHSNTEDYDKANQTLVDFYKRNKIPYDSTKMYGYTWANNYNPMGEYIQALGQQYEDSADTHNEILTAFEQQISIQQQNTVRKLFESTYGAITNLDPTGQDINSWTDEFKTYWRDAIAENNELELEGIKVKFKAETGLDFGEGIGTYADLADSNLSQLLQSYQEYATNQIKTLRFDFKVETGLDWGTTTQPDDMSSESWGAIQQLQAEYQSRMDQYSLTNDLLTFKANVGVEFSAYPYEDQSSLTEEMQTIFNRLSEYTNANLEGDRTQIIPYLVSLQPELEVVYDPINTGIQGIHDQISSMVGIADTSCSAVVGSFGTIETSANNATGTVQNLNTAISNLKSKTIEVKVNYTSSGSIGSSGNTSTMVPKRHASGGVVASKTLSWLGEEGYPETVIPLAPYRRQRALNLWKKTGDYLGVSRKIETGGQVVAPQVQVSFQITANNGVDIVSEVEKHSGEIAQKVAKVLNEALQENFTNTPVRTG